MDQKLLSADFWQQEGALRARLGEMSAACQVLERRCRTERELEYVDMIQRSVLRSLRILQNRELARRLEDEDELRVSYATVELKDWCRSLTEEAAELLREGGVNLSFRAAPGALTTLADEELLSRMLLELLSNGAKHTAPGGQLVVSVAKRGGFAVLTVGDEGGGIREESLARLLSGDESEPDLTAEAGAGLGLRLARRIAELHGGQMLLDTTEGEGSRAAVTIPLREGHRERLESPGDLSGGFGMVQTALSDVLPASALGFRR